jgi:ribose/xylose/arabinose/galactoside ABC-type transport system permease subunit
MKDFYQIFIKSEMKYKISVFLLGLAFITCVIITHGSIGLKFIDSFNNIVFNGIVVCLFAIGVSTVIASGGVDLSSSGVATLSGVIMAIFINMFQNKFLGFPIGLYIGFIISIICSLLSGFFLGYFITNRSSPPLVFTWTWGIVLFSVSIFLSRKAHGAIPIIIDKSNHLSKMIGGAGGVSIMGVKLTEPDSSYLFLFALSIAYFFWFSGFPRKVRAVGANSDSATYAGISVKKTIISTYVLNALLSSIAGMILLFQTSKASTTELVGKEIIAIAIAVLGGTVMSGGYLNIFSVVCAAFFYAATEKLTNSIGIANDINQNQIIQSLFALVFIFIAILLGKQINGKTEQIQIDRNTNNL